MLHFKGHVRPYLAQARNLIPCALSISLWLWTLVVSMVWTLSKCFKIETLFTWRSWTVLNRMQPRPPALGVLSLASCLGSWLVQRFWGTRAATGNLNSMWLVGGKERFMSWYGPVATFPGRRMSLLAPLMDPLVPVPSDALSLIVCRNDMMARPASPQQVPGPANSHHRPSNCWEEASEEGEGEKRRGRGRERGRETDKERWGCDHKQTSNSEVSYQDGWLASLFKWAAPFLQSFALSQGSDWLCWAWGHDSPATVPTDSVTRPLDWVCMILSHCWTLKDWASNATHSACSPFKPMVL